MIYEIILKMKKCFKGGAGISLTKEELEEVLNYITNLEKKIRREQWK